MCLNITRSWIFLSWDIRGINSQAKWDHLRDKISECAAYVVCQQETKRESFDQAYISKFCSRHLNKFAYSPSLGASGGLLICWSDGLFSGELIDYNEYAITMNFISNRLEAVFHLTNIYGPSSSQDKAAFINWLYNFDLTSLDDWILVGDFNLIRSLSDRNKPGGNVGDMLLFNDLIQHLDLVDIPFSGRHFTWSNMQYDPLLKKLDWVFTSSTWTNSYPTTSVICLARPISDHVQYVVSVDSHIPKASLFRFENYWVEFPGFFDVVKLHWESNPFYSNMAKTISGKFKQLIKGLKSWSKGLSNLNKLINNCSWTLALLDGLEDQRVLSLVESNFRKLVKAHLQKLLEAKRIYWKQRSTIRWVKFGDENTKLFQTMATHTFRRNSILLPFEF